MIEQRQQPYQKKLKRFLAFKETLISGGDGVALCFHGAPSVLAQLHNGGLLESVPPKIILVDVSMLDGSTALQAVALSALRQNGFVSRRGEGILTGALPNYNIYRCRDGKHIAVGAVEPKFFTNMLKAVREELSAPLLAFFAKKPEARKDGESGSTIKNPFGKFAKSLENPARARRLTGPVRLVLAGVFLTRTRDQWTHLLQHKDACVTPTLEQFSSDIEGTICILIYYDNNRLILL